MVPPTHHRINQYTREVSHIQARTLRVGAPKNILYNIVSIINSIPTLSSWSEKPRPARTLVLYLMLPHLMIGLMGPAAGRGAIVRAFLIRLVLLLFLRAGWLNHVRTLLCQSFLRWTFGSILLPLGAMVTLHEKEKTKVN